MKKILVFILCFFSLSCFANDVPLTDPNRVCGQTDLSHPNFCAEFANIAYCNCDNHPPLSEAFCRARLNMDVIYHKFVDPFGGDTDAGLKAACERGQHEIAAALCYQQWSVYRRSCPPAV